MIMFKFLTFLDIPPERIIENDGQWQLFCYTVIFPLMINYLISSRRFYDFEAQDKNISNFSEVKFEVQRTISNYKIIQAVVYYWEFVERIVIFLRVMRDVLEFFRDITIEL